MKNITRALAISALLGLSSLASASTIDLQGNLNIEGFSPLSGDLNQNTYGLHLTNLTGNAFLDSTPVTTTNGSITLDSLGSVQAPNVTTPVLSLINIGLSALPANFFGTTFNFDSGFGSTPITNTVNNVVVPVNGVNIAFDSITITASNNSIDILFTESTSTGSIALLGADATLAQATNNNSISSGFNIQGSTNQVSAVPVPAAIWLMGSGLLGLFGFSRKKSA